MLFVLDFFDRDLFVLINQRWASPALDSMMIFLSSKWAFMPLYAVFIWLFWRKFGVKCWVPILLTVASFGLADSISSKICKPMFARGETGLGKFAESAIARWTSGQQVWLCE